MLFSLSILDGAVLLGTPFNTTHLRHPSDAAPTPPASCRSDVPQTRRRLGLPPLGAVLFAEGSAAVCASWTRNAFGRASSYFAKPELDVSAFASHLRTASKLVSGLPRRNAFQLPEWRITVPWRPNVTHASTVSVNTVHVHVHDVREVAAGVVSNSGERLLEEKPGHERNAALVPHAVVFQPRAPGAR